MWPKHKGIISTVAGGIILAMCFGTYNGLKWSIEARAEQWLQERIDIEIGEQRAITNRQYQDIISDQAETKQTVKNLDSSIKELNRTLIKILQSPRMTRD
ncbi:MAG: hypothetical protein COA96_15585 [SAR86 cluster bacterium]|uniref:Uncharacterized protein n=1 Tax=SAR86 cluster bacterium TaxID=2030880 RepID=A0A2A5ANJ0_9GAMM|nr:MAG: hypothetical protein COA96_15585 [SAR86 cluster bacterium]